ncbi:15694_t:CDS:1, partial [Dentiscutata heterogama]
PSMLNAPVWNLWLCKTVGEAGSLSDSSSRGVLSSLRRLLSRKSSGVSVLLV